MEIPKIVLCLLLVALATSFQYRQVRNHLYDHMDVSNQCCKASGGKLCGMIVKSCCDTGGCQKTWYGQVCKANYLNPVCRTCSDECTEKPHGTVCKVSVSNYKIECCAADDCQRPSGNSTLADKIIDKAYDKSSAYAASLLKNEEAEKSSSHHHQGFVDKLLDKLAGPSAKCKPNTTIALPANCIPDSLSSLLAARIF